MGRSKIELMAFALSLAAYLALCLYLPAKWPDAPKSLMAEIEVLIPSGSSASDAARILAKAGLVTDSGKLAREMAASGIDRRLRPGLYKLRKGTPAGVVKQLQTARPLIKKVMLIPGAKYADLLQMFGRDENGRFRFETALQDKANFDPATVQLLPQKTDERALFLLPETYFVSPGEAAASEFVKRASALWYRRLGSHISKEMDAASLLRHGILASIVEGEAKFADEQPVLSGIFMNRLDKKMKLQSCATVVYAWGVRGEKKSKLSYDDLKIDSPFNTYAAEGLPPGPVCVPGYSAWMSALKPKPTEYLFFFAGKDGRHIFSKTYEEHIAKQKRAAKN